MAIVAAKVADFVITVSTSLVHDSILAALASAVMGAVIVAGVDVRVLVLRLVAAGLNHGNKGICGFCGFKTQEVEAMHSIGCPILIKNVNAVSGYQVFANQEGRTKVGYSDLNIVNVFAGVCYVVIVGFLKAVAANGSIHPLCSHVASVTTVTSYDKLCGQNAHVN